MRNPLKHYLVGQIFIQICIQKIYRSFVAEDVSIYFCLCDVWHKKTHTTTRHFLSQGHKTRFIRKINMCKHKWKGSTQLLSLNLYSWLTFGQLSQPGFVEINTKMGLRPGPTKTKKWIDGFYINLSSLEINIFYLFFFET